MSLKVIKEAAAGKKMICPKCKKPIQKFEKYAETIDAVREGLGFTDIDSRGSRVTLTCGNEGCDWTERTEYWSQYIID
jgi:RNase P subunit RPR2